ncbi:VWA domain-containing protein [Glaciecola sp. MH2013]|uniref:vWA domain-containing protein n=1 Tax=Glaciecola sp. MH2013 TaxID=2785524 RepID=UPI00189F3090|nr:VWA domain-containing protein [Glaciecola sp. MH2013]MBF7073269.1 VWA domain-containing protein [Glaciecola sp. MH2013]
MFEFAWPYLFLILPLPLLFYFLLPSKQQGESAALLVPSYLDIGDASSQSQSNGKTKLLVASLIWALLVSAAARPQWLGEPVSIPSEGRDLMIAVDLSGSMKLDDMQINGRAVDRLSMTKYVLADFIERRVGDRLGLILFADTAYLQAPLTFDRDTVGTLLNEAVIGLVGEKTAIGDAIGLAVKRFDDKETSNRVLILLTDGQNTAGNLRPELAKELAVDKNVTIYTIGVGAEEIVMNSLFGRRTYNPSQDLDEKLLTDLAKSTGGQYFRARDAQEMQTIYEMLDQLEPIQGEGQTLRPLTALFYLPLMLAVALVFLHIVIYLFKQSLGSYSRSKAAQEETLS